MEIRNCTSLVLNIIKQDGEILDLPPCGSSIKEAQTGQ